MLKIFGYSTRGDETQYGVSCGVVVAENLEKAIEIIASSNYRIDFDKDDIKDIQNTYTIKEIPFNQGVYFIDSYFE